MNPLTRNTSLKIAEQINVNDLITHTLLQAGRAVKGGRSGGICGESAHIFCGIIIYWRASAREHGSLHPEMVSSSSAVVHHGGHRKFAVSGASCGVQS